MSLKKHLIVLRLLVLILPATLSAQTAKAIMEKGVSDYNSGNYQKAVLSFTKAITEAEKSGDVKIVMMAGNNLGNTLSQLGRAEESMTAYLSSLSVAEKTSDLGYRARILKNIGTLYSEQKNFTKALHYYRQSIIFAEQNGDRELLADCYNNIGVVVEQQGDFDRALKAYKKALIYYEEVGDQASVAMTRNNLAIVLKSLGQLKEAAREYEASLALSEKLGDAFMVAATNNNIGNLNITLGNWRDGVTRCMLAHSQAKAIGAIEIEVEALDGIATGYEKGKQLQQALDFRKKYEAAKDQYLNRERARQLSELSVKYESEKKAADIGLLKQRQQIISLQIKEQQSHIGEQKRIIASILIVAILLLVAGALTFYLQKTRSRLLREKAVLQTEQAERNRMAKDIHDDLGSGLAKINFLSEVILNESSDFAKITSSAQSVRETAIKLVENMRDLIWALNADNATLDQLVSRIREYATDYLDVFGIDVYYEIDDMSPMKIKKENSHHILMVVKEALNNLARHSSATKATIKIHHLPDTLELKILDNGKGFPRETATNGNGLANMKKRMHSLGGSISIDSTNGTLILLRIPLA